MEVLILLRIIINSDLKCQQPFSFQCIGNCFAVFEGQEESDDAMHHTAAYALVPTAVLRCCKL